MFLVPFRLSTSWRGLLPIFRNSFFGHSGRPGSQSNSRPPPPAPPPQAPCRWPGPSAPAPGRFLPAGRAWARSWRGGPAPARKLESLCSRPAPPGEGRRERSGGRAGRPGRAGPGLRPRPGLLPALPPRPGLAGSPRHTELALPRSPTGLSAASAPTANVAGLVAHLGARRGAATGPRAGAVFRTSRSSQCGRASVGPSVRWGKESRLAGCLWISGTNMGEKCLIPTGNV